MLPAGSGLEIGAAFGAVVAAGAPAGAAGALVPPYGEGALPPPPPHADRAAARRPPTMNLRMSGIRKAEPPGCVCRSAVVTIAY